MKTENKQVSVLFMLFGILFCVCLITANVLETKQISIGAINITGGLLVFPVSYIINGLTSLTTASARCGDSAKRAF